MADVRDFHTRTAVKRSSRPSAIDPPPCSFCPPSRLPNRRGASNPGSPGPGSLMTTAENQHLGDASSSRNKLTVVSTSRSAPAAKHSDAGSDDVIRPSPTVSVTGRCLRRSRQCGTIRLRNSLTAGPALPSSFQIGQDGLELPEIFLAQQGIDVGHYLRQHRQASTRALVDSSLPRIDSTRFMFLHSRSSTSFGGGADPVECLEGDIAGLVDQPRLKFYSWQPGRSRQAAPDPAPRSSS